MHPIAARSSPRLQVHLMGVGLPPLESWHRSKSLGLSQSTLALAVRK
jgi:hypothetical protein